MIRLLNAEVLILSIENRKIRSTRFAVKASTANDLTFAPHVPLVPPFKKD